MREVKSIKTKESLEEVFSVVKEILRMEKSVRICLTGESMYPFIRNKLDIVELSQVTFPEIIVSDIVLVLRNDGQYVLHRVVHKNRNHFYINGDAQQWIEGPLRDNQLIARMSAISRGKKWISCHNFWWIFLSKIWVFLLPYRKHLFKILGYLAKINKYIRKLLMENLHKRCF